MVMSNINFAERIRKNQAGFTFIELLIATVMSLVILGLLAQVFRSQQKEFGQQSGLNTMQANGRAATEFIARSVQNAGFNVSRGTRFLAASDHYLTAVYDANNDDVITNDEVITYTLANTWSGTASENYSFVARFDVDGDGIVEGTENPTVNVGMTTSAGPPFNLYKVIPSADGTSIERSLVARNIDNMRIRYYDRNGRLLPTAIDTSSPPDGTRDTPFDADNDGVPDVGGNWTYDIPANELNDIRKVEIEILARSRKSSPRETIYSGSYPLGTLAAVTSGSTSYSDMHMRETFTAEMSPRNLVLAPWGSIDIRATPAVVACPTTDAAIVATLLDANGDAVGSTNLNFTATGTGISVAPSTDLTDSFGEGVTTVTYNYTQPYITSTISASATVTDVNGDDQPVFSAAPVSFSYGTQGGFVDRFDGLQLQPWNPLGGVNNFETPPGEEYFRSELVGAGNFVGSINGCGSWEDYSVQANLKQEASTVWQDDQFMGLILRQADAANYYWISVVNPPGLNNERLEIGKTIAGGPTVLRSKNLSHEDILDDTIPDPYQFEIDATYTIKAQIVGDDIRVKFWKPADPNNPNADEPTKWSLPDVDDTVNVELPVTDPDINNGSFGLGATDNIFQFDDVKVTNPSAI